MSLDEVLRVRENVSFFSCHFEEEGKTNKRMIKQKTVYRVFTIDYFCCLSTIIIIIYCVFAI